MLVTIFQKLTLKRRKHSTQDSCTGKQIIYFELSKADNITRIKQRL